LPCGCRPQERIHVVREVVEDYLFFFAEPSFESPAAIKAGKGVRTDALRTWRRP